MKTELGPEKICLKRELENLKLPAISSSRFIRTLYDVIDHGAGDAQSSNMQESDSMMCLV